MLWLWPSLYSKHPSVSTRMHGACASNAPHACSEAVQPRLSSDPWRGSRCSVERRFTSAAACAAATWRRRWGRCSGWKL
jgi:hypothetical protein